MTTAAEYVYFDAPMERDRGVGWRYVRDFGDVFKAADGTWVLTSPEAVQFAHHHPEIFSSARAFDALASPVPLIPIAVDPPDHARFRRVLDPMLAPRVINAMEDSLRAQARELIEAFADKGHCDAMADLARLYPTQVFLTLFGMPLEDRDQFIHWAETIIENSNTDSQAEPSAELVEAAMALFGYLQSFVDEKRANPAKTFSAGSSRSAATTRGATRRFSGSASSLCWPVSTPSPRRSGSCSTTLPAIPFCASGSSTTQRWCSR